jgi:predicted P-loop ATPase
VETAYHDRPRDKHPDTDKSSRDRYSPNLAGAINLLTDDPVWQGVLAFNSFTGAIACHKPPPWRTGGGQWADEDDHQTAAWLQEHMVLVSSRVASEAVGVVASRNPFHPVKLYLERLEWDHVPRLDLWLTVYLGVEHNEYTSTVGQLWMRSAVARVYKPGCKVDYVLVLEGKQGLGKSQSLKILAGHWFSDDLQEFGTKDTAMHLPGHWIIELPEISNYTKYKGDRLKAFLTRRVDCYKPPYGRRVQQYPRQCVFAGTTDRATWLYDEEGNRRYWPVHCERADFWGLAKDREQLWAEAVHQYKSELPHWPDNWLIRMADGEQKTRLEQDCWGELIDQYCLKHTSVSVSELLAGPLSKMLGECTQADQNRVVRHLRINGWVRRQVRLGGRKAGRKWVYTQPTEQPEVSPV